MAIMSETVKAARKARVDLEKRLLAAEKSVKRSLARATKFDVKGAIAKLRSNFSFAAQKDLRNLIVKVDELEAKVEAVLASTGKSAKA